MLSGPQALLLSGRPGVGKTTIIRKAADALQGQLRISGFYTEELLKQGMPRGFRIVTFDGQERVVAHVSFERPPEVGEYGVDISLIDALIAETLSVQEGVDLYVIDEIGELECLSARFTSAIRELLDQGVPLIATLARTDPETDPYLFEPPAAPQEPPPESARFIDEVKDRQDTVVWEVTASNRDHLPSAVVAWLSRHIV